jgi:twitching motility protein PilI
MQMRVLAENMEAADPHQRRLREFSAALAEKLRAAPSAEQTPARLAVRIGEERFLLDMAVAGEIVAVPAVAPVPWTKPWFRGLANVRGRLVGVIDLPNLAGRAPLAPELAQQLLVFGTTLNVNAALLITRAFGLRNVKDLRALDGVPADPASPWLGRRFAEADGSVLTELDLPRLVTSELFTAIGT